MPTIQSWTVNDSVCIATSDDEYTGTIMEKQITTHGVSYSIKTPVGETIILNSTVVGDFIENKNNHEVIQVTQV